MDVYLDNAATTKVYDSVKEIMIQTLREDYGNPSSRHQKGIDAERYMIEARKIIGESLKVDAKEIVFTSGGTESNNMALFGAAMAKKRRGNHIITTKIEHPSVYNPMIALEEMGYRISYLKVDSYGKIDLNQLEEEICSETILISIIYVNNEIGSVQEIGKIGQLIQKKNEQIVFHVDAIQAYGKYKIYPRRMGIDLLSVSGHKIHGPKGCGFLYIRDKVNIKPILFGGGQQKGMRSGTENIPGIAGLGKAVEENYLNHEKKIKYLYFLKTQFIQGVREIEDAVVRGITEQADYEDTAPHIICVSFLGIKSEVLLHTLESKNIYVSSGSACSSNRNQINETLKAVGLDKQSLDSTIRFSLSMSTTLEEIEYTLTVLKEVVPILRKYTPR